jgi:hypothetical protein
MRVAVEQSWLECYAVGLGRSQMVSRKLVAERVSAATNGRPGAKAPMLLLALFEGLKPHANPGGQPALSQRPAPR